MSLEQEGLRQQREIDAEVAASAVAMRLQRARDQGHAVRAFPSRQAARECHLAQRETAGVLREQFLDAREQHLAAQEQAAQQREAGQLLRSQLLEARERQLTAQERAADQREINAELVSRPAGGTS